MADPRDNLRKLADSALNRNQPQAAAVWLNRLLSISAQHSTKNVCQQDLLLLATAQYRSGDYYSAIQTLESDICNEEEEEDVLGGSQHGLSLIQLKKIILKLQCLMAVASHDEALELIMDIQVPDKQECDADHNEAYSTICFLKGACYIALEDRSSSVKWLIEAMRLNPFCIEAFEELMDGCILVYEQEKQLLEVLDLPVEFNWLRTYYECRCVKFFDATQQDAKLRELEGAQTEADENQRVTTRSVARTKQHTPAFQERVKPSLFFGNDGKVLCCRAAWYFRMGDFIQCYNTTSGALLNNPHALEVMPVHIAACMQLQYKTQIFDLAHKLIEYYPNSAICQYAIGCYYMLIKAFDQAEKFYHKATIADPGFAAGWVGYGDSFAAREGTDQAMSAYRRAARMFPGLHQPLLNMGMEYMRMKKLDVLAEQMFAQAMNICPTDPHITNELGVLFYNQEQYKEALSYFKRVIHMVGGPAITAYWEPTIVNQGHCLRKLGRYQEAIRNYERALGVRPGQADTYAALAFTHHLKGDLSCAIQNYHAALAIAPNHNLAREMFETAIKEEVAELSANGLSQLRC